MVLLWALIIFALDQGSKFLVENSLELFVSHPIIVNIFHLTLLHNTGGAFGIFQGRTEILVLVTLVLFFLIFRFRHLFPREKWWHKAALGLLVGGAAGNFFDRIFRGYVIDFLDFQIWPVFNVADAAITGAIFLFFFQVFLDWRAERNAR